jgi:hypothetical protein
MDRQPSNGETMMQQKACPYCHALASHQCAHLAVAVEGRDFVRRCVESCQGEKQWRAVCERRRQQGRLTGEWSPEQEDYTWLETAFCAAFLKHLRWFGSMDYEWRSGSGHKQGGFWVLVWSKDPRRMWWELRDEFERQATERTGPIPGAHSPKAHGGGGRRAAGELEFPQGLREWNR